MFPITYQLQVCDVIYYTSWKKAKNKCINDPRREVFTCIMADSMY